MGFEIQHSTDLIVLGSKERNIAGESGGCSFKDLSCSRLTLMGEQENWAAVTFTETWGMFKEKIKKKLEMSVSTCGTVKRNYLNFQVNFDFCEQTRSLAVPYLSLF